MQTKQSATDSDIIRYVITITGLGISYWYQFRSGVSYQNDDCILKNKFIALFTIIFGSLSSPINLKGVGVFHRTRCRIRIS